jgi:lycopene cyclase domain-containing protein
VTYTIAAGLGVVAALALDTVVLRTWLVRRKAFWTAYAIVLVFQLIVNGLLTGLRIVRYDPSTIIGWRIAYAPVEDLVFGFALATATLSLWVWWGRRAARATHRAHRAAPPLRDAPG